MQALDLHRLAEGYFSPTQGSLGQGGISSPSREPLGDDGQPVCMVQQSLGSPEVMIWSSFLSPGIALDK